MNSYRILFLSMLSACNDIDFVKRVEEYIFLGYLDRYLTTTPISNWNLDLTISYSRNSFCYRHIG